MDAVSNFALAGCRLVSPPIPFDEGEIVAKFTINTGPFLLIGVALIRDPETGALTFKLPNGKYGYNVRMPGRRDREELMAAMRAAYLALGGTIADQPLATAYPVASGTE